MKEALQVVLATAPDIGVARTIARTLVDERLVACVNIVGGVTSIYRWQGKIEESAEALLVMKTVTDRLQVLVSRVKDLHPNKVPEVIALPVDAALPAYAQWVVDETAHLIM
jgi:periplasmic divalent cation tolerance protein